MAYQLNRNQRKEFLLLASDELFLNFIEDTHPVDLLDVYYDDKEAAFQIFDRLPESILATVIDAAQLEEKYELLSRYSVHKQKMIVEQMSSDELADLVGNLNEDEASKLFETMDDDHERNVRKLLSYDPQSAGGIMATEFIALKETMTVEQTLHFLQDVKLTSETVYYLYVVDNDQRLKGVVSLRDFISSPFDTRIGEIMNENVFFVTVEVDQEVVAKAFQKYGYLTMPVVSDEHVLLGIVTIDDILDIIQEETTEDIHQLAGINAYEKIDGTIFEALKSRSPCLFLHVLPSIFAVLLVSYFHETIEDIIMLAIFMPVMSILGRNAAIQSLTVTVRAMTIGALNRQNGSVVFVKELMIGAIHGILLGVLMGVIAMIISGHVLFGVVVGLAIWLNMIGSTISGFLVPVVLRTLRLDPAYASSVTVTTLTETLGYATLLGLATTILSSVL